METYNASNLSSSLDYNSFKNSWPKILTQSILIGGADYEPDKNSEEVEYSVLSQHLDSKQNLGGRLDRSSSKPTLVKTLDPSTNFFNY